MGPLKAIKLTNLLTADRKPANCTDCSTAASVIGDMRSYSVKLSAATKKQSESLRVWPFAAPLSYFIYVFIFFGSHLLPVLLVFLPSVPPSLLQHPLPLSLPVHMSVVPLPWQFLPLSQAELGPLFSNSTPFSFSQSLFMVPPHGWAPRPGLQASFGPYSVTQVRVKDTGQSKCVDS